MPQGTLWIGTFGGGLNALRDGKFFHYDGAGRPVERQHRQGIRRRRVAVAEHDARHLPDRQAASSWISAPESATRLEPHNYGVEDGLRSAQCAPAIRSAGGGIRTADGRLWFTTGRGLAVSTRDAHSSR